MATSSL